VPCCATGHHAKLIAGPSSKRADFLAVISAVWSQLKARRHCRMQQGLRQLRRSIIRMVRPRTLLFTYQFEASPYVYGRGTFRPGWLNRPDLYTINPK
jgi:hypothetical protein